MCSKSALKNIVFHLYNKSHDLPSQLVCSCYVCLQRDLHFPPSPRSLAWQTLHKEAVQGGCVYLPMFLLF